MVSLLNGLIFSRYMFIFCLKNPAAFNDDFWCRFINIWIFGVSVIPQVVNNYLSGSLPIMFHICSGTNPKFDLKNSPMPNFPLLLVGLLCVTSYLFFGGKILMYKNKKSAEQTCVARNIFLKSLEKQSLSDFTTSTFEIICGFMAALLYFKIRDLAPEQLNFYPNYLLVYFIHLVNGPLTCIIIITLCYYRNEAMRKVVTREIKHLCRIRLE